MGRQPRTDVEGGIHHVMNRGVDHQQIFFADADRVEFGRLLGEIHTKWGVETLAYCLMDNHYHLILHTPDGGLSEAMQYLGVVYTRHTNDRVGRDGPICRGRFASMLVTTDSYLLGVLDRLTPSACTRELVDSLDFPTATARRMALKRSRDRAQDPAVDRIIRSVVDEWPARLAA
jgi:REP element-mobilizing transposase RayT